MIELLQVVLVRALVIYATLGVFMVIIAYLTTPKKSLNLAEHLINISFFFFWLPYFYIYFKKYR